MVFGKNLYFNNHYLSEFDLQLASIKSSGLEDKDIGLELDVTTLNTGKNPCSHLVGMKYADVLSFEAQAYRILPGREALTLPEYRMVERWLTVSSYSRLEIDNYKALGCYFMAIITDIRPIENGEQIVGISFRFSCDAPWAWEDFSINIDASAGKAAVVLQNDSDDLLTDCCPIVTITKSETGPFSIQNQTNQSSLTFHELMNLEIIQVDNQNLTITSSIENRDIYSTFGRKFLTLSPGENKLLFTGASQTTISGRFARKVGY